MAYFIGLMSGTSIDAIDVALVEFSGDEMELVASHCQTLPASIRVQLDTFIRSAQNKTTTLGELDVSLGYLFAESVLALLKDTAVHPDDVTAIGSHGQTVFHAPNHKPPFTLQIGDANIIAEQTGITTVADFRRRDIAAGGQGAPLVPAFHNALFRSTEHNRVIVNIGGIANITVLPADPEHSVLGFDTGPGNTLLDLWARKHTDQPMDKDGQWASGGTIDPALLSAYLSDPYFSAAPPKSTGRELFNLQWLNQHPSNNNAQNIQATLCQLTADSIAQAIQQYASATEEVFVCGGGAYNKQLMNNLTTALQAMTVNDTTAIGLTPDCVEAVAFAWLAKQTMNGKPGNLPAVTGAGRPVVLGGIYPGRLQLKT